MMIVIRYDPSHEERWNAFVATSKNATFLIHRQYLDYHRDRFLDHSVIVLDGHRTVAILPACEQGTVVVSHAGLTYGGLILGLDATTPEAVAALADICRYYASMGFAQLIYKTIPHIYHVAPAEEDRYALFTLGAALWRIDVLSVVDVEARIPWQSRRRRATRSAQKTGALVRTSEDFRAFWGILEWNLATAHRRSPVHLLDEIQLLHSRFPDNIVLHACFDGTSMIAGILIYLTRHVAHVQYIASNPTGRTVGAIDLIVQQLVESTYADMRYVDLGASNEQNGRILNLGLIAQKEGFGARSIVHEFFKLELQR